MVTKLLRQLQNPVHIWPLVVFRIGFGLLMLFSTLRFVLMGWVEQFYIAPAFHFTYWGFGWVQPLPGDWMYAPFAVMALCAVLITIGAAYRPAMVLFFLSFTYVELLDQTYYLNHYYFVSLLSFVLIWLPLNRAWAVDSLLRPSTYCTHVPRWSILSIQLLLGMVYFYAGLAKLQPDWLIEALPLKLWLPARAHYPVIGPLLDKVWFAYGMSWAGAFYDLTIPFFLFWRRSRPLAYAAVVVFHFFTWALFFIGVFPWVMMVCTLIFFDAKDWKRFAKRFNLSGLMQFLKAQVNRQRFQQWGKPRYKVLIALLGVFFMVQLLMPLRFALYPGNILWNQEGFRFSWRVMLVEANGHLEYELAEPSTGKKWLVYPVDYLTIPQVKQMAFQPDMILQFAHHLGNIYKQRGQTVEVRAISYVSVNGRSSKPFIDPTLDLMKQKDGLAPKRWILP